LLSPRRARDLFEVYNTDGRHSRRLVNYNGYDLIVNSGFQIFDTEAYLIAPNKYTLFVRQVNETDAIKVYRSDFIDLTGNTPPPLDLHVQDVIDAVQNNIGEATDREPRYQQLFMFPMPRQEETPVTVTECPKCSGEVQRIGGESYFCLECDWDNLPALG
ncbi:MAG: hypothetical protein O7E52_00475, partial [Candidatus Poribacteria bacterium]|nr:hypothetical protein [Candidatus Poribacteria bacterium]